MLSSRGPRTGPCGTPYFRSTGDDDLLLITGRHLKHLRAVPQIPWQCSKRLNKMLGSIVSKEAQELFLASYSFSIECHFKHAAKQFQWNDRLYKLTALDNFHFDFVYVHKV